MKVNELKGLNDYLNESSEEFVFLTFDQIENINGSKLPNAAKKARWWHNNPKKDYPLAWISAGYWTDEPQKNIQFRCGIAFKKYIPTKMNTLKNNKLFCYFIDAVIGLIVSLVASQIIYVVQNNIRIDQEIREINTQYKSHNYEGIEEKVLLIADELERKERYADLCELYEIVYEINYERCICSDQIIDDVQFMDMRNMCIQNINYAVKSGNTYHYILSNNNLGKLYLYQYKKNEDIRNADKASYYLDRSYQAFYNTSTDSIAGFPTLKEYESIEDINTAIAGIETYELLFKLTYSLILNGEYEEDDLRNCSVLEMNDNVFFNLFKYDSQVSVSIFFLIQGVKDSQFNDIDFTDMVSVSESIRSRASCLYYILSTKVEDGLFNPETFSYDSMENTLIDSLNYALNVQNYSLASESCYCLVKLSLYRSFFEYDLDAVEKFSVYYKLWNDITCDEYISLIELDKEFCGITSGPFLDLYIEEELSLLEEMALEENPSLFCYTQWDLGNHYFYKVQEMITEGYSPQQITETLLLSRNCYNLAQMYFTDETNKRIHDEIILRMADIELLLSQQ